MHSVLFAQSGLRGETFARIFESEGYGTRFRTVTESLSDDDLRAAEGSTIVFVDLTMGPDTVGHMLRQLRAYAPVGRSPLIALIGEPAQESFDDLIRSGADLYITDNPQTLAFRTRFLRGALERRAQLARALADVRISEAKYRAVISVLEDGIVVRRKDGSIETINDSVLRMVGMNRSTLVAENWAASPELSMVCEDGTPLEKHEQPGFRTLATGEPIHGFVCGLVRPGQDIVWMSLSSSPLRDPQTGELTGSVTSMTDISTRRRAEDDFLTLLDRVPDGVMIHRDGKILWANTRLVALLGYSDRSELVGRAVYELLPARDVEAVAQRLRDRAAGLDVPPLEHSVLRADGTELAVEINGIPTIFRGAPAMIAYGRDVSERRNMEAQLITSDRLASLGRLAASVGHELNNPLTYVIGNVERALGKLRDTPGVQPSVLAMLDDAAEGANRMRRIVDDLRMFARRPNDDASPIDVSTVIAACLRMTQGQIGQRARLVVDIGALPLVHGNEARLAQVVTNLLLNAVESIAEPAPERNEIAVRARTMPDGRVELSVTDTGAGIAPEHLPMVFEPFFTTKTGRGGTGLGLAISRSLVLAMGGELTLTSPPGGGTQVTVRLAAAAPGAAPVEAATFAPAQAARWKILLVDDEPKIAELLRENLEPHDVTIATDGATAIALLAVDASYDAIVCDLMMPGTSGMDLHEWLRGNQHGLEERIVFMTGGAFTSRASAFLSTARNRCLAKPFEIETLLQAIDEVAKKRGEIPDAVSAR